MIIFGSWNHYIYRLNDSAEKQKIAIEGIKKVYSEKSSTKIENFFYINIYYYLFYLLILILILKILKVF